MLSDEEKAIEELKNKEADYFMISNLTGKTLVNLIEKQQKEIEELKDDRKKYTEEYIHNNPWLYKQLNENYILRVESEQKERKAWIKGTNDADELCNKKWEDKIKAKIDEVCESTIEESNVDILYSLLEKE